MIKIKISMNNEQKSFQFFKIIHDFFLNLILIKLIYTLVKQKSGNIEFLRHYHEMFLFL